ncbi:hypothetical protein HYDPIDRAFT_112428 [Hydnomerulius pinastri MD-312]|uniref:Uncharacterized protein n=1 Tax=Hydnomerulius pinastri MD-312 TaxID=994086 RepID=A0A0C9WEH5_9AGAM|nr:hypothetical protein HYDPIDRAFT_112428 [Hydnomerulius pinastri MD-312]
MGYFCALISRIEVMHFEGGPSFSKKPYSSMSVLISQVFIKDPGPPFPLTLR